MRLVFIDMHCINFLTNTYSQIKSGTKLITYKHKYIIDYALRNNIDVLNYVTGRNTTDGCLLRKKRLAKKFKVKNIDERFLNSSIAESKVVIDANFGKDSGIGIITDVDEIQSEDVVIGYILDEKQRNEIERVYKGHKVMMGNHFIALNEPFDLQKVGIEAFVNEIDMTGNVFIDKYINCKGVKKITCPYTFGCRFKNHRKKRKNKAMVIGTLSTCKGNPGYKLYRKEFRTEWIQLIGKEIFDHAKEYPEAFDSYISYILEDQKKVKSNDSFFMRKYKEIRNRHTPWTQSKYTSFDMVEKFNEYKMFVRPEEVVGFPGIGFIEGMACGTAYIGLDAPYYRDLGLVPGVHYITYDGTLAGLVDTIKKYQNRPDEVDKIAYDGMEFVRKNFNIEKVAEKFISDLEKLTGN